jgi:hypothetical protein
MADAGDSESPSAAGSQGAGAAQGPRADPPDAPPHAASPAAAPGAGEEQQHASPSPEGQPAQPAAALSGWGGWGAALNLASKVQQAALGAVKEVRGLTDGLAEVGRRATPPVGHASRTPCCLASTRRSSPAQAEHRAGCSRARTSARAPLWSVCGSPPPHSPRPTPQSSQAIAEATADKDEVEDLAKYQAPAAGGASAARASRHPAGGRPAVAGRPGAPRLWHSEWPPSQLHPGFGTLSGPPPSCPTAPPCATQAPKHPAAAQVRWPTRPQQQWRTAAPRPAALSTRMPSCTQASRWARSAGCWARTSGCWCPRATPAAPTLIPAAGSWAARPPRQAQAIDDSVEQLATGAVKALGGLWSGLTNSVLKVEAAALGEWFAGLAAGAGAGLLQAARACRAGRGRAGAEWACKQA